jgi:hypothetical protein
MREEVADLRDELGRERGVELAVRIGVNTGEAVTGPAASGGSFTAGDTVNVAARLEQAARPGDIVIGCDTLLLVRHAVDAEPVAPLMVKGKRAALEAFRLLTVAADARGRAQRPRAPMVGRQRERRRVFDAFHQAVADRSCQLFTVLGAAGVGKSRLVAEVLETIDGAATVAAGRCLPYGDGLTWWPLVEAFGASGLIEQAASDDARAAARAAELLRPAGEPVAYEEAFWAVRKVLEALARRRPLVLVVDDLQWAEPTFIDLLEHVADWTRDAPLLLLLIMARPEVLDTRPGWGGGKLNATTVLLEPLPETDARDLLRHLTAPARLGDSTVARILAIAEGNPLFVEEVIAMLIDDGVLALGAGDGPSAAEPTAIAVPPTIHALIAARLDRLDASERTVIEGASIEGKEFSRQRLEALVGDGARDPVDVALHALCCAATVTAALELACANGDRRTAARAGVVSLRVTMTRSKREADRVSMNAAAKPVLHELEALGDDEGLAAVLLHLGHVNQDSYEQSSGYLERAMVAAERVGDRRHAAFAAGFLGSIMVFGPVPAAGGIERCRALRRRFADQAGTSAVLLRHEAVLHAMENRIDEARTLHAEAVCAIDDLGSPWLSASTVFGQWLLELLAGAPERAEASARTGLALLEEMGATNDRCGDAGIRARQAGPPRRGHPLRRPRRRVGRARTRPPRRFRSSALVPTSSRRAASLSAPRLPREKRCDSPSAPTRSTSAATRLSTSPPCWTAPAASATRPRRSETPSPSTSARATWFPPPAPTQVWSDWDTGRESPTRSRRREPSYRVPSAPRSARQWRPQRLLPFDDEGSNRAASTGS